MDKLNPNTQKLTILETVKRRPGMYIGGTDYASAIFRILYIFLLDPPSTSPFTFSIVFHTDQSFTIEEDKGILEIEEEDLPKQFQLPNGLFPHHELVVLRVATSWLTVDVWQNKQHYQFKFVDGEIVQSVTNLGTTERQGSRLQFLLNPQILHKSEGNLDFHQIVGRARSLAACLPGVHIRVALESDNLIRDIQYKNGLQSYLTECLDKVKGYCHPPLSFNAEYEFGRVSIALSWINSRVESATIFAFINGERNYVHGTHIMGLQSALYKIATAEWDDSTGTNQGYFITQNSVLRGLGCAISLWLNNLSHDDFGDYVALELISPKAQQLVEQAIMEHLPRIFAENPECRNYFISLAQIKNE